MDFSFVLMQRMMHGRVRDVQLYNKTFNLHFYSLRKEICNLFLDHTVYVYVYCSYNTSQALKLDSDIGVIKRIINKDQQCSGVLIKQPELVAVDATSAVISRIRGGRTLRTCTINGGPEPPGVWPTRLAICITQTSNGIAMKLGK